MGRKIRPIFYASRNESHALPGSTLWTGVAMLMSCRCSSVSVWKRRSAEPELKAIQMPTPATTMWDTTMPSSWWASSCLWEGESRAGWTGLKHYLLRMDDEFSLRDDVYCNKSHNNQKREFKTSSEIHDFPVRSYTNTQ